MARALEKAPSLRRGQKFGQLSAARTKVATFTTLLTAVVFHKAERGAGRTFGAANLQVLHGQYRRCRGFAFLHKGGGVVARHVTVSIKNAKAFVAVQQQLRHVGDGRWVARLAVLTRHVGPEIPLRLFVVAQFAQLHPNPGWINDPHVNREQLAQTIKDPWVLPRTWILLKETLNILLEGVPEGIDLPTLNQALLDLPGVHSVHELHVWAVSSAKTSLSAHVVYDPQTAQPEAMLAAVNQLLVKQFEITHTTIQLETEACDAGEVVDATNAGVDHWKAPS